MFSNSINCNDYPPVGYWNKGGFVLCVDGRAEVSINEQNYILTRGSAFIITPLVHVSEFRSDCDYRAVSFVDDLKEFYSIFRMISDTGIPLSVRNAPCWHLSEEVVARVCEQYRLLELKRRRLDSVSADERRLTEYQIGLIKQQTMIEVVCDHIRNHTADSEHVSRQEIVAYRFMLSLHSNFRTHRSVAYYADEANLSVGYFSSIIRNTTGRTPSQWVAELTVSYAKLLLEYGGRSIKEIARELNFPEQFTFRKYFRHYTGFSPKEYMRLCNKRTV